MVKEASTFSVSWNRLVRSLIKTKEAFESHVHFINSSKMDDDIDTYVVQKATRYVHKRADFYRSIGDLMLMIRTNGGLEEFILPDDWQLSKTKSNDESNEENE